MINFNVGSDCQVIDLHLIYNKYFHNIHKGTFVEVGAYDGKSWSNTCFLADIGWKGLYIEPIKQYADSCTANHINNNVIVENCAIGCIEDTIPIYVREGLTTLVPEVNVAHDQMYKGTYSTSFATVVKLETLLRKHNIGFSFDLLVVDTEGYELEVFQSFSLDEYRPKMIIVELCDVHSGYDNYPILQKNAKLTRDYITDKGYQEIYRDCINTIFISDQLVTK
jgi:FkbM family methyltransferase